MLSGIAMYDGHSGFRFRNPGGSIYPAMPIWVTTTSVWFLGRNANERRDGPVGQALVVSCRVASVERVVQVRRRFRAPQRKSMEQVGSVEDGGVDWLKAKRSSVSHRGVLSGCPLYGILECDARVSWPPEQCAGTLHRPESSHSDGHGFHIQTWWWP
ncbi:hypothetical protein CKAH01_14486 [Colletotrichum kahawae]|uniref:Uncharacterized protein n=1 Tax=Colletotrichum kahawae TaxID=34407 RepID=A0AAD9YPL3_COLKA|nr:hypothetical protein CKAH01_14486 [Colletotrichum kahawae]